jgi:hypothetical protein
LNIEFADGSSTKTQISGLTLTNEIVERVAAAKGIANSIGFSLVIPFIDPSLQGKVLIMTSSAIPTNHIIPRQSFIMDALSEFNVTKKMSLSFKKVWR